jgi:hypothetical protein
MSVRRRGSLVNPAEKSRACSTRQIIAPLGTIGREPSILPGNGEFFNVAGPAADGIVKECPAFASNL